MTVELKELLAFLSMEIEEKEEEEEEEEKKKEVKRRGERRRRKRRRKRRRRIEIDLTLNTVQVKGTEKLFDHDYI